MLMRPVALFLLAFSQPAAAQTARVLRRPPEPGTPTEVPAQASLARQVEDSRPPVAGLLVAGFMGSVAGELAGWNLGHGLARSRGLGEGTGTFDLRFPGLLVGSTIATSAAVHLVDRKQGRFSDALAGAVLGAVGGFFIAGATSDGDFNGLFMLIPVGQASLAALFSHRGRS